MIRKDYLMKLIEEAAYVMAKLMGLRKDGKDQEALHLLDETYDNFFKFEGKLLRYTDKEALLEILLHRENLSEEQLAVVADLLRNEAEVWTDKGEWTQAKDVLEKALMIVLNTC